MNVVIATDITSPVPLLLVPLLPDNSLGGVECTAHHPGSRGVADIIVSVTMPLLSIKDLAVAIFRQSGAC